MSNTSTSREGSLVVSAAQFTPKLGEVAQNLDTSVDYIADAARQGSEIVVLPELANAGWGFQEPADALASAESVTDGRTIRAWCAAARSWGVWVCAGFAEAADGQLFNSAVLISPKGVESLYRKVHVWGEENLVFSPGDLGFPVTNTPWGRAGMAICYDAWVPESFRSLGMGRAELALVPSNWVAHPRQFDRLPAMAHMMMSTGAHSNQFYVVAASRCGSVRDTSFIGQSIIVDYEGWPLATAGMTPEIVSATINPLVLRETRESAAFNRPLFDRRPSQYTQ